MAFKLAKLSVPDIGKAYGAGLNMKQTRLSNEVKEEAIAQKKATNEEYGNFLSENNPESIVDPVDENNNGKIDPEEETNALQATGRKYKAWDKIRDDKEIAARRAAVEGRSIRAEQRAVEKHQKYLERNELAASQKRNIEQSHREVGEELGYTGGRLDQYVQLAMKDKNLAQAAFRQRPDQKDHRNGRGAKASLSYYQRVHRCLWKRIARRNQGGKHGSVEKAQQPTGWNGCSHRNRTSQRQHREGSQD